jgi:hypothetical protein
MEKKNCFVFVFIFSLFVANLFASPDDKENNDLKNGMSKLPSLPTGDIIFVNTGKMHISSETGGIVYVPQSIRMLDEDLRVPSNIEVVLDGDLYVGGDFYQDAAGPVFKLETTPDSLTVTSSIGTIHFMDHGSGDPVDERKITTTIDFVDFSRDRQYIAFPNVQIDTNDSIVLTAYMGMDAFTLKRKDAATIGTLTLASEKYDTGLKTGPEPSAEAVFDIFDASLRIFGEGYSEDLVDAGSVIVAREVSLYRADGAGNGVTGVGLQLFPFATPFKNTQLAGYFAGNWIRVPTVDASDNYHTRYVLGNKPRTDDPNMIAQDQYERYALHKLEAGQPYLIKLRAKDFDYDELIDAKGLAVTKGDAEDYEIDKFIFNGTVFNIPFPANKPNIEQLFADDVLVSRQLSTGFNSSKTLNWVIGNSYTCPIALEKLVVGMQNTGITFSNKIYIYSVGSQSYEPEHYFPVTIENPVSGSTIKFSDYVDIPAMGVFMVRVAKNKPVQSGYDDKPFRVDKGMLRHSAFASHGLFGIMPTTGEQAPSSSSGFENQIRLTMNPEDNNLVYDRIAIGLRPDATFGNDNYDAEKIFNNTDHGYQLYTMSSSLTKLSINGLPHDAPNVDVYLKPAIINSSYILRAADLETLSTEGAWLEDLITKEVVDLFVTNEYKFETTPNDPERRFILHFKKPSDIGGDGDNGINSYYYDGNVFVKNLTEDDLNSLVTIYDVQGRIIKDRVLIDAYPTLKIPVDLIGGVYVTQIKGTRNLASKFVK